MSLCSFLYGHFIIKSIIHYIKGPLSGLKRFLTTESLLKMIENVFYFMIKGLFILDIFTFLS